jgi:hypothetical protein
MLFWLSGRNRALLDFSSELKFNNSKVDFSSAYTGLEPQCVLWLWTSLSSETHLSSKNSTGSKELVKLIRYQMVTVIVNQCHSKKQGWRWHHCILGEVTIITMWLLLFYAVMFSLCFSCLVATFEMSLWQERALWSVTTPNSVGDRASTRVGRVWIWTSY